jgi:hypothetical protein
MRKRKGKNEPDGSILSLADQSTKKEDHTDSREKARMKKGQEGCFEVVFDQGEGEERRANFLEEEESRPEVGSSRKRRSGSLSISIPMLSLRDSPPLIPRFILSPTLLLAA